MKGAILDRITCSLSLEIRFCWWRTSGLLWNWWL